MPRGAHTAIRGLLQHQAHPACPGTSCTAVEICSPWHAQSKVHPQRVGHVAGSWRDDLHVLSIHLSTGISKDSTGAWVSFKRSKRQREFSNPTVTFVVEKKKKCIHASKVTVTENWESFLSSGEDFAFEGHRCSSCSFGASMGSETQVSLSTPVWKCRTLLDCSGNEQHHPESPITLLARQEPGSMELSSCLCDKSCTSSQL